MTRPAMLTGLFVICFSLLAAKDGQEALASDKEVEEAMIRMIDAACE